MVHMGGAHALGTVASDAPPNSPTSCLANVASAHSREHRIHWNGDLHSGDVHLAAESEQLDLNKVCRTLPHEGRGNKYCDVLGCYWICSNVVLLSRSREEGATRVAVREATCTNSVAGASDAVASAFPL